MDTLNTLIDASIRGTMLGITIFFWIFGLVTIWKWILNVIKRLVYWLFPNLKKKEKNNE
ncbi:MAG: hypothetical protein ACLTCI_01350 [[Clostridium] nexile]|nr:MAG TPA: hypothetical protein [Caudoviricetes sp.]